ncbi:hypothetical protein JTB14_006862 [Gonioctena quinquepunctata]|nr:hypothetical protein JTB14_006862 [Gonioctena quinquepunctata]
MMELKVVSLVIMCICVVACDKISDYLQHSIRVNSRSFPCSKPQPRMIYLKELVGDETFIRDYKKELKNIRPVGSILYRCENAGCCRSYNEKCKSQLAGENHFDFYDDEGYGCRIFRNNCKKSHKM